MKTFNSLSLIILLSASCMTTISARADTYVPVTCVWETGGTVINNTPMNYRLCHVGSDMPLIETYTGTNPYNCQITLMDNTYTYTGSCSNETMYKIVK